MLVFPNAKINLGLNVISKRPDGYHDISSVLFPIPLEEALEIVPSSTFEFSSSGLPIPGHTHSNLVVKAWELLNLQFSIPPVHIHLHKCIPMGGGLGGGSADAAFALSTLNKLFNLDLSVGKLQKLAAELGSDCPFFIENKPALASGRGTELMNINLDLSGYYLLLVFPEIHSSTKEAYEGLTPSIPAISISEIIQRPVSEWKADLVNDFEKSIFKKYPELKDLKKSFYDSGADYAAMSGSGSTMFGIFRTPPDKLKNTVYHQLIMQL